MLLGFKGIVFTFVSGKCAGLIFTLGDIHCQQDQDSEDDQSEREPKGLAVLMRSRVDRARDNGS